MNRLFLHACCAPCLTYTTKRFDQEYKKVTAFWFNPNIHPFTEYKKRFQALRKYEEKEKRDIEIIYLDEYKLESFLKGAIEAENRCEFCLQRRFEKTAKEAKKRKYDAFTSTLVLSPYQDHDLIKRIGAEVERKTKVEFIYEDMRDGFSEHHRLANELNLYKQGYCGCIFSEKDRYHKDLMQDTDDK